MFGLLYPYQIGITELLRFSLILPRSQFGFQLSKYETCEVRAKNFVLEQKLKKI